MSTDERLPPDLPLPDHDGDSDSPPDGPESESEREWVASWNPPGSGQVVVQSGNLEFSGSASERPEIIPPATPETRGQLLTYLNVLEYVTEGHSVAELRQDLGDGGRLQDLAKAVWSIQRERRRAT